MCSNCESKLTKFDLNCICFIAFIFVRNLARVGPGAVIEKAQSVSWPDGVKGDLNQG